MSMLRRTFNKIAASVIGFFSMGGVKNYVAPPTVEHEQANLAGFCLDKQLVRDRKDEIASLVNPFVSDGKTYATDMKIAIELGAGVHGEEIAGLKLAPGAQWWKHDKRKIWLPWPERKLVDCSMANCPECGSRQPVGSTECECFGDPRCFKCKGSGWIAPALCSLCRSMEGNFRPLAQTIGKQVVVGSDYYGMQIEGYHDNLIRRLPNPEFAILKTKTKDDMFPDHVVMFRFAGGRGIVMPVYQDLSPMYSTERDTSEDAEDDYDADAFADEEIL